MYICFSFQILCFSGFIFVYRHLKVDQLICKLFNLRLCLLYTHTTLSSAYKHWVNLFSKCKCGAWSFALTLALLNINIYGKFSILLLLYYYKRFCSDHPVNWLILLGIKFVSHLKRQIKCSKWIWILIIYYLLKFVRPNLPSNKPYYKEHSISNDFWLSTKERKARDTIFNTNT